MAFQKVPYIGSVISLVSKLDIRYEGILFEVNTTNATISLAKVRSHGTEDRPTLHPVPARDDIYDYIVFKAADIKDLVVCEPKLSSRIGARIESDPAIVSVSNQSLNKSSSQSVNKSNSPVPSISGMSFASHRDNAGFGTQFGRQASRRSLQTQRVPMPNHRHPGVVNNFFRREFREEQAGNLLRTNLVPDKKEAVSRKIPTIHFESDYDFEAANEKFRETLSSIGVNLGKLDIEAKDEEEKEEVDESAPVLDDQLNEIQGPIFYDKKRSFFDSISSEVWGKENGRAIRPNWKMENRTNEETFGHTAVRSLSHRGGQGGRGSGNNRDFGAPGGGNVNRYRYTISRNSGFDA